MNDPNSDYYDAWQSENDPNGSGKLLFYQYASVICTVLTFVSWYTASWNVYWALMMALFGLMTLATAAMAFRTSLNQFDEFNRNHHED